MKTEGIDEEKQSEGIKKRERLKRREDAKRTELANRLIKAKRPEKVKRAKKKTSPEKTKRTKKKTPPEKAKRDEKIKPSEKAKYNFDKLSTSKEVTRGCWLTGFLSYTTFIMFANLVIHVLLLLSVSGLFLYIEGSSNLFVWYIGLVIIDILALIAMIGLVRWQLWGFMGVEGYFAVLGIFQILNFDIGGAIQSAMLFFILGYLLSMKMQKFQ